MNTPPITKEPATMTTKPAADTFRLARRLAKTLSFDGVQTIASAFSLDGTDYIITRGTGEGDFAYDASDVDGWLEHLGRERASYSEDFCQALTPVADVELAWAVLQEEGFALCREGDCRAVLAGERCERGSEDDIRRGTIQVMSGARADILWDGDDSPSIWTTLAVLRPESPKTGPSITVDPDEPFAGLVADEDVGDLPDEVREKGARVVAVEILTAASAAGCGTWDDVALATLTRALDQLIDTEDTRTRIEAAVKAADGDGVIQAPDAVRVFPGIPTMHGVVTLDHALKVIGGEARDFEAVAHSTDDADVREVCMEKARALRSRGR